MSNTSIPTIVLVGLYSALIALSVAYVGIKRQYETQQVCDRSHAVISGSLEQVCAQVQDKYHTEYLCNSARADAICWVELK